MTNHIHLLLERQAETVGSVMQRVLGGYSRYHNRRYPRVGHVFQGRHRSILCQSETYHAELVRWEIGAASGILRFSAFSASGRGGRR